MEQSQFGGDLLPWYAVQVRTKGEISVSKALNNKGFETYLPLYKTEKVWSDRVVKVELPLFPGYVFCQFDPHGYWLPLLQTAGVHGLVSFGKTPAEVDRSEIDALRHASKNGALLEPWPFLRTGQRVLVEKGSLAGLEGILLEIKKHDRLILSVSLLQRSVALEIERSWVRPIAPSRHLNSAECELPKAG